MGRTCCIRGCKNTYKNNKTVSYHKFPVDSQLKKCWLANIKLLNGNQDNLDVEGGVIRVICSAHFEKQYLRKKFEFSYVKLKSGSIPTLFSKSNATESENIEVLYSDEEMEVVNNGGYKDAALVGVKETAMDVVCCGAQCKKSTKSNEGKRGRPRYSGKVKKSETYTPRKKKKGIAFNHSKFEKK